MQKLTPGFTNHMRNMNEFKQAAESQKSWSSMGFFCPNNTFLHLKHIKMIYLTLLSTNCVKIHQIPHVIFQTESQEFFKVGITFKYHERSFFCTFLAETLYAFEKSSTLKCKLAGLPVLALKFTKLLMSFLEPRVSSSLNLASLFSVMWYNF